MKQKLIEADIDISEDILITLDEVGISTFGDIEGYTKSDLQNVPGVGIKTAEKLLELYNEKLEEESESKEDDAISPTKESVVSNGFKAESLTKPEKTIRREAVLKGLHK